MEGFLTKKGKGESQFGRKSWKRRWFTLEGTILRYYEDMDFTTNKMGSYKGEIDVLGCEIDQIDCRLELKYNTFSISAENRSPFILQAENDRLVDVWINALKSASRGEVFGVPDYNEYYELLGVNPENEEEKDIEYVTKLYRKVILKVHPDKGGTQELFERTQDAFEALVAKDKEDQLLKTHSPVQYTVEVGRRDNGKGLCLIVTENPQKKVIEIKKVLPEVHIRNLSANAAGELLPGDTVVKVRDEELRNCPLIRLVQKINEERVPKGSFVKLTCQRLVPNEIALALSTNVDQPGVVDNVIDSKVVNEEDVIATEKYDQLRLENDHQAYKIKELEEKLVKMQEEIEISVEDTNKEVEKVRKNANKQLSLLAKNQKLLKSQLTNSYLYGAATNDEMLNSLQMMADISEKVISDDKISVSASIQEFLMKSGLGDSHLTSNDVKYIQRRSILAAASVREANGMRAFTKDQGDETLKMLHNFESLLSKIEEDRHAEDTGVLESSGKGKSNANRFVPPFGANIPEESFEETTTDTRNITRASQVKVAATHKNTSIVYPKATQ